MKKLLLIASVALSTSLMAESSLKPEKQFTLTVEEITQHEDFVSLKNNRNNLVPVNTNNNNNNTTPPPVSTGDRLEATGKVISVARDMVALGEAIYDLVKKGKPSNVTEYAPISVVPKDPATKEIVDIFDLENFSMPMERTYVARIKSGVGREVVTFKYKVMYSYGGSWNGTGKYLAGVIVVPQSVRTTFGWDFNASMKLSGMMNHGTKANPVAGVMITIKYQMNSWTTSFESNDTIHITGRGEFKNHMIR